MRVVVARVLTASANAVLVAKHLLKLGATLTTALARLQVQNLRPLELLALSTVQSTLGVGGRGRDIFVSAT
jgi:hypothetical protein